MVNWTADKDQIILNGIFEFHDIKLTAPLLKHLASKIGGDCSAKAVSCHLGTIRKGCIVRPTAAVATTPKTPSSRLKSTPRKKKTDVVSDEDGPEGLDEQLDSPTAARGKHFLNGNKKHSYTEAPTDDEEDIETDGSSKKRVKQEPVEEELVRDEVFDDEV